MVSFFRLTFCTSCFKAIMSTTADFLAFKFSVLVTSGCGASSLIVFASSSPLSSLSSSSSLSPASPPPPPSPSPSSSSSSSSSSSFWAWLAVVTSSGGDSESISFVVCIVSSNLARGCSICLICFLIAWLKESLVKRGNLCCSIGWSGRWSRNSFNSNFFSL